MNSQYYVRYRKALHLPVLILGVERKLFFINLVVMLSLSFAARMTALIFYVPIIGIALHCFFTIATKADPLMTDIFIRARRHYPNFHPALSSPEYEPDQRVVSSLPELGMRKKLISKSSESIKKNKRKQS